MRRYKFKRGFLICTVFLLLLNLLTPFSFATQITYDNIIPPCPAFPLSENLPFGSNTLVLYYRLNNNLYWYFVDITNYNYSDFKNNPCFVALRNSSFHSLLCLSSIHNIKCTVQSVSDGTYMNFEVGSIDRSYSDIYTYYISFPDDQRPYGSTSTKLNIYSNNECLFNGRSISTYSELSVVSDLQSIFPQASSYSDYDEFTDSHIRYFYPNATTQGINALMSELDNLDLSLNSVQLIMDQYYISIDNSLSELQSQVSDLSEDISILRSSVDTLPSEYQSQLAEAQSEIESNVNSAASQAADDVNNAGEDISDIENDVSDVNGIVSKCSEWVSDLDVFANRIEEAETGVASALENGKSLVNGFLGVSPPIVIALLTFCLCWFVVRKVIGR